jgi:hypothetical protein
MTPLDKSLSSSNETRYREFTVLVADVRSSNPAHGSHIRYVLSRISFTLPQTNTACARRRKSLHPGIGLMKMRGCSSMSIYRFTAWHSSIERGDIYIYIYIYGRSSGLDIEFIDHLYTRLRTTRNYSAIANLHKSPQHPPSLFQPAVSSRAVPLQRFLTVILQLQALKLSLNGGSLPTASFLHNLQYRTESATPTVFLITPLHNRFQQYLHCYMRIRCKGNVP